MKAFLLAAGHGTRLRPLTDHLPKCLLPIKGTPLLAIWLEQCRRFGIHEVLVNIHSLAGQVRNFLERENSGVKVTVIEEATLLGSAGTVRANAEWVADEELFWIFYADVLTVTNLDRMLELQRARKTAATLGVYRVPHPERCGIVRLDKDDIVQEFIEKPAHPVGNLAFSGLMIGTQQMLSVIPEGEVCDIGFDVLPRLAGAMAAYLIEDYLLDIGTPENYQLAQETWPGLQVADSDG